MKRVIGWFLLWSLAAGVFADDDAPHFQYSFGTAHRNAVALNDKAQTELSSGQLEEARRDVEEILRTDPDFWLALYTRARISMRQHKWDLVIRDCNAGLKQSPSFFEFAILRAVANRALGNCAAALAELDHVLSLHPGRPTALSFALDKRAWTRIDCAGPAYRKPEAAIADAKQACNLMHWKYADHIDTLACAYAEAAQFDTAIQTEERAIKAAGADEQMPTLQRHLTLFQQHQSIRSGTHG